ncbi:MAG: FAD-dependent thymidylate synthase [Pseudomonadota bacterium]|nr:FAD-dependent thymidylate synthase [Pseudomonadota bacterium]
MIELQGKGCTVKVIADSVAHSIHGKRITTLRLRYWRAIHAEFLTHRMFSRNASSSRAIPVAKMIEQVRNDPAGPIFWGSNQPGMQAGAELSGDLLTGAKEYWREAAQRAADYAGCLMNLGVHKQVANRALEPFQYISVIVTATEWQNFFALRAHPDAQPEIQDLAETMQKAMAQSKPVVRTGSWSDPEAWHLPYVLDKERLLYRLDVLQAISTARNARVSYLTHDGAEPVPEKDLALNDKLVGAEPLHASPTEHIAAPLSTGHDTGGQKNFMGWHQYRSDVEKRIARSKKPIKEKGSDLKLQRFA